MKDQSKTKPSVKPARSREPLSGEVHELTAQRLRVLADAKRIALLEALSGLGEAGVGELADQVGLFHQPVSRALAILHQAGVVSRRREGTATRYVISDWSAWWVVEQIARWVQACQAERASERSE